MVDTTTDASWIELASTALRRQDLAGAIELVRQRWAQTRDPRLGELVESISGHLKRMPLAGKTRHQRRTAWLALAESGDAGDLPRLLGALSGFDRRNAGRLLEEMADFDPDPRTATFFCDLLMDPPDGLRGQQSGLFWSPLMERLAECADERHLGRIDEAEARRKQLPYFAGFSKNDLATLRAHAAEHAAGADHRRPAMTDIAPLVELASPSTDARARRARIEALLAQVYATPDRDDVRAVLADALSEDGDPRGELIVLQMHEAGGHELERRQRQRQNQLLRAFGRHWLGPLDGVLARQGLVYERGFPVAGRIVSYRHRAASSLANAREWATFRSLDARQWHESLAVLISGTGLGKLRELTFARPSVLALRRAVALETLGLIHTSADGIRSLAISPHFPRLRRLDLRECPNLTPANLRPLWADRAIAGQLDVCLLVGAASEWSTIAPTLRNAPRELHVADPSRGAKAITIFKLRDR